MHKFITCIHEASQGLFVKLLKGYCRCIQQGATLLGLPPAASIHARILSKQSAMLRLSETVSVCAQHAEQKSI